ncbi:MAG: hydantoinase B/oxoprolinase family protein [Firmicutes bacterium]|nr:hydantoinase B/oxoprolinase family protein [Bacillota bacterium]
MAETKVRSDQAKVKLDQVTYEILQHRMFQILMEARYGLMRVSGSPVVCETGEAMYSMYDASGRSALTASGILLHVAGSEDFLQRVLQDYSEDPGIFDGDMFFFNDPYIGGIHAADQWLGTPIFHEGEIVCWLGCLTHTSESGAIDPGGMSPRAREIFHEGIRLPGLKVVEKGRIRPEVMELLKRAVRDPGHIALDTHAKIAGLNIGKRRVLEVIERYGIDVYKALLEEMITTSNRLARAKLEDLPDGTWRTEVYGDHDGVEERPFKVALTLTKTGGQMVLDFTGTDPQNPGPINCTFSGLVGSCFVALASILFWDVPWNHGMMEPVEIRAPLGTLVNCEWPAPCAFAPNNPGNLIAGAVTTLIGRMLVTNPKYHQEINAAWRTSSANPLFGGKNQFGIVQANLLMDTLAGGSGAGIDKDGCDTGANQKGPETTIADVESSELAHPFLYLWRREATDHGGPGKWRGGTGPDIGYMIHKTEKLFLGSTASGVLTSPAVSLFGGYPGASTKVVYALDKPIYEHLAAGRVPYSVEDLQAQFSETGEVWEAPSYLPFRELKAGDIIAVASASAGGYGDPIERDPERVRHDVRRRVVSREAARLVYGVALGSAPGHMVQPEATVELRELIRRRRLARGSKRTGGAGFRPAAGGEVATPAVAGMRGSGAGRAQDSPIRIHEYLQVIASRIRCLKCDADLGPASGNYKDAALRAEVDPAEAGGPRPKDPSFTLYYEHYCPGCGTLLQVDPAPAGSGTVHDIEIKV